LDLASSAAEGSRLASPVLRDAHAFEQARIAHWDAVAADLGRWSRWSRGYHDRLAQIYRALIPPGHHVLEAGCGAGDLLASVRPSTGVGVDFAPAMIASARSRHPGLTFVEGNVERIGLDQRFDYIVCSDLVNDLWDVQATLENLRRMSTPGTRLVLNFYSRLWEAPLRIAKRLGISHPLPEQNWLTVPDVTNLLHLAGYEVVRRSPEVLWPFRTPLIDPAANRVMVKSWPFSMFALTHVLVARPVRRGPSPSPAPRVSVIIPARNESGNIANIMARVPEMGAGTELIFVEGHSKDDTRAAIAAAMAAHPERRAALYVQEGTGKGDAVRLGFARSTGDVLMILDADLTVAPEDLPRFYDALQEGVGEFVNGVRLVYPMQDRAMRLMNLLGNKFFSLMFSWLLGQPIKDTLCGTKVLWRADYAVIEANRGIFGGFDPFGDFDLLFGAAATSRRIVEVPVRYRERTYGETNIRRWSDGWLLLKMALIAARRLKWV
jgi:SAM-dependent methyltransferase